MVAPSYRTNGGNVDKWWPRGAW